MLARVASSGEVIAPQPRRPGTVDSSCCAASSRLTVLLKCCCMEVERTGVLVVSSPHCRDCVAAIAVHVPVKVPGTQA